MSTSDYLFITCRAKFCIKDNFQGLAAALTSLSFVSKEQAIVVARGKPAKIVSKKEQVQFIQSNFFTNKPKVILFYLPVLRLRSLQRRETTSSIVERRKQVSKRVLITS